MTDELNFLHRMARRLNTAATDLDCEPPEVVTVTLETAEEPAVIESVTPRFDKPRLRAFLERETR